jgi:hypothetical protein
MKIEIIMETRSVTHLKFQKVDFLFHSVRHNILFLRYSPLAMERLFSPCTRLHDMLESQGLRSREPLHELNLDVSTEDFLSGERAFKYADLHAVLGNEETLAWLTPHAFVTHAGINHRMLCDFYFIADDKVIIAFARSSEALAEIADVVLRLLASSAVHSLILRPWNQSDGASISTPALAHLMEQCQSLKNLTWRNLALDENHCRVLGAYSRPDLEIVLCYCKLTSAGTSALAEGLEHNQGPTVLDYCDIDYSVLANGLRGNSRLKRLRTYYSSNLDDDANRQVLAIANAVRENKGLVELELRSNGFPANDEAWGAICDSLKAHPALEVLTLFAIGARPDVTTFRIQALVDMMKVNTSIYTIHLDIRYSRHQLFRESVIPYLETNRLRPCLLAIQKTRPIAYRAKLLGRALLAVRTDPNRLWMLLAGNAEIAFPSTTTAIAAAAKIPTPATAMYTANVAAVAAFMVCALTTTSTGSLPAATATHAAIPSTASALDGFASTPNATTANDANVATPSAGQKRRARP